MKFAHVRQDKRRTSLVAINKAANSIVGRGREGSHRFICSRFGCRRQAARCIADRNCKDSDEEARTFRDVGSLASSGPVSVIHQVDATGR